MKPFSEYEKKKFSEVGLTNKTALALEDFLDKRGMSAAFKIGVSSIQASSHVGSMVFQGEKIEILPKLLKYKKTDDVEKSRDQILKNLLTMLSYTHKLKVKSSEISSFDLSKNSLLDVFIYLYSRDLLNSLIREYPYSYNKVTKNLTFVRGKIKFQQDLKVNIVNKAKVFCEFNSFERNNLFTQTFLFTCEKLLSLTGNDLAKKNLKSSIKILEGVSRVNVTYNLIKDQEVGRSYTHFEESFNFCKMFLKNSSPNLSNGEDRSYCILFDMNLVFEEFIYEYINQNKDQLGVEEIIFQNERKLFQSWKDVEQNKAGQHSRDISNDMYITFKDENMLPLIIDTKYKVLEKIGDVSTSDYFQVFNYRHVGKKSVSALFPRILLLYPEGDKSFNYELTFNGPGNVNVFVQTISLWEIQSGNFLKLIEKVLKS